MGQGKVREVGRKGWRGAYTLSRRASCLSFLSSPTVAAARNSSPSPIFQCLFLCLFLSPWFTFYRSHVPASFLFFILSPIPFSCPFFLSPRYLFPRPHFVLPFPRFLHVFSYQTSVAEWNVFTASCASARRCPLSLTLPPVVCLSVLFFRQWMKQD